MLAAVAVMLGIGVAFWPTRPGRDQTATPPDLPSVAGPAGQVLATRAATIAVLDLELGTEQPLYQAPDLVMSAAWEPTGRRVVFSQVAKTARDRQTGADLLLLEDGRIAPLVRHGEPDEVLHHPSWSADGETVVFQVKPGPAEPARIEVASTRTGKRTVVEPVGGTPHLSPDGALLAYVEEPAQDGLTIRSLTSGQRWSPLPAGAFTTIGSPRFSPDGRQLAFVAGGWNPGRRPPRTGLRPLPFDAPVALAHGPRTDLWTVNVDGSELREIASLPEDDITRVTWALDGSALLFVGGRAIWRVSAASGAPVVVAQGPFNSIDWRMPRS